MEEDGEPPPQPRAQTLLGQEETGNGLCAPTARGLGQEERGGGCTAVRAPSARHARVGGGLPRMPDRRGGMVQAARAIGARAEPRGRRQTPRKAACTPSARYIRAGGGEPPETGGRGRVTPRAACAPSAWHARTGGGGNHTDALRGSPEQRAPPAHSMQGRRRRSGAGPQPEGVGGHPPSRRARPSCAAGYRIWEETPTT